MPQSTILWLIVTLSVLARANLFESEYYDDDAYDANMEEYYDDDDESEQYDNLYDDDNDDEEDIDYYSDNDYYDDAEDDTFDDEFNQILEDYADVIDQIDVHNIPIYKQRVSISMTSYKQIGSNIIAIYFSIWRPSSL